jgi:hypothetical protein
MSTPEQQLAEYAQLVEMAKAAENQHKAAVDIIVGMGRDEYGPQTWDEMADDVVNAIGRDKVNGFMGLLQNCDAPTRVVAHLAENPDRAKKIAGMTAGRAAAELGRIEAELMPVGAGGGADPLWVAEVKGGRKRGLGDELSDSQWEKNYEMGGREP